MNVCFRRASDDDGDSVSHFIREMLREMESVGGHEVNPDERFWAGLREGILDSVRDASRLYLFALVENEPAGFIEARIDMLHGVFAPKRTFHISAIYVVPDRRREGIAASLMRRALEWASEQGCEQADLNVLVNNDAKGLYEKFGFEVFQQAMHAQLPASPPGIVDGREGEAEPSGDGGL